MKRKSLLTLSALALSASVLSPMATQAAGSYSSNTIVVNTSNCEDLQNILSQYNINCSDLLNDFCGPNFSTQGDCLPSDCLPNNCLTNNNNCDNQGSTNPEETETPEVTEPETPEISEPGTPETTDPETPETTEPGTPEITDPGTPEITEPETPESEENSELSYAEQVVKLVNIERANQGLAPLAIDKTIESAALVRAKETVTSFSHTRPNGSSFSTALKEAGVSYRGAAENIAYGQKSPEAVVEAWMNSSGHRANILNSNYTKIGVGYFQRNGVNYWTQLFTY